MRRKTVTEIALAGTLCAFVLCIFVPVIYCIWSVKKKKKIPQRLRVWQSNLPKCTSWHNGCVYPNNAYLCQDHPLDIRTLPITNAREVTQLLIISNLNHSQHKCRFVSNNTADRPTQNKEGHIFNLGSNVHESS